VGVIVKWLLCIPIFLLLTLGGCGYEEQIEEAASMAEEALNKVTELEAKIEELESTVEELESRICDLEIDVIGLS
jgi:outer membrane murein-binding lipoprotein Lpp